MEQQLIVLTSEQLTELIDNAVKKAIPTQKETIVYRDEKELMTRSELLEFLQCSSGKLHILMKEGKLPYLQLGRNVYFKRTDVMNALEEGNKIDRMKGQAG